MSNNNILPWNRVALFLVRDLIGSTHLLFLHLETLLLLSNLAVQLLGNQLRTLINGLLVLLLRSRGAHSELFAPACF